MIEQDDFDAWLANPITKAVIMWARKHAADAETCWLKYLESPPPSESLNTLLVELKTRIDLANQFADVELKDIQEDEEPERDQSP